ncbi:hypothetical protein RSOLAG22IIIB_01290 [Rhizoctonia solani]|uniref:BTB domain-containing protein n=1 Tax=Rhizoctonia solani TaxID=456999 RepID=A0A0K6G571_9AGAM|nr:hypothetical protein RSOLAG22IIIB_01290 [Rhizoctonia solani]
MTWPFGGGKDKSYIDLSPKIKTKEVTPTLGNTNNQYSMTDAAQSITMSTSKTNTAYPNPRGVATTHDFTETIIKLQVNDVTFKIPESRILKFASLNKLAGEARRANPQSNIPGIVVHGGSELASDFFNTFELLGTSLVEPVDFSADALVSAARISATYDYPTLRAFCIEKLEGLPLGAIERLRIGRAIDLQSWEERVCKELSERDEMVTKEEMLALGADAYWRVASTRETQRRISQLSVEVIQGQSQKMSPQNTPQTSDESPTGLVLALIFIVIWLLYARS